MDLRREEMEVRWNLPACGEREGTRFNAGCLDPELMDGRVSRGCD